MAFNEKLRKFVGKADVVWVVRWIEQAIGSVPVSGRKLNGSYRR